MPLRAFLLNNKLQQQKGTARLRLLNFVPVFRLGAGAGFNAPGFRLMGLWERG